MDEVPVLKKRMQSVTGHVIIFCNSLSAPKLDFGGSLKGKEKEPDPILASALNPSTSLKHPTQEWDHHALPL